VVTRSTELGWWPRFCVGSHFETEGVLREGVEIPAAGLVQRGGCSSGFSVEGKVVFRDRG
jgi:hypothetical protein